MKSQLATAGRAPAARPAAVPREPAAIVSPFVDALFTGGLSLLVLVPLLVMGRTDVLVLSAGVQAWVGALVNMPHFLASYRMVYRTKASIRAHPWAAIYVPILLLIGCIGAVIASRWTDIPISALLTISSTYLAWHYTSQAWGMVATFTYLDGNPFNALERKLVRASLYILAAWHIVWFFYLGYDHYVKPPSRNYTTDATGATGVDHVWHALGLVRGTLTDNAGNTTSVVMQPALSVGGEYPPRRRAAR